MRWPWQRAQAGPVEPRRAVSSKTLELQAAMEILAEVFRINLEEVEDMISSRLPEAQTEARQEEGLWPQEFWLES